MNYELKTKPSTEPDHQTVHVPVLLQSVVDQTKPKPGDVIFDGTYGAGGYSRTFASAVEPNGIVVATDQDPEVITREIINSTNQENIHLHHANFSEIDSILRKEEIDQVDIAVLDLGISSDQLDSDTRGISFRYPDAPLDMRMNTSEGNDLTAWGIINVWEEHELADMLYHNADEAKSRRIAKAIMQSRKKKPIDTVGELVEIIHQSIGTGGKSNSATRTFQALRIEVNRELHHLQTFLAKVYPLLKTCGKLGIDEQQGGVLAIVSFHSIEDRIVKQKFREWKDADKGTIITKKPIRAKREELLLNKRARSATLRIFQKTT